MPPIITPSGSNHVASGLKQSRSGDILLDEQGNDILVTELAVTEQDLTAYNLTIDNIHTYYAGTQPTLIHNCGTSTERLPTPAEEGRKNPRRTKNWIRSQD